MIKACPETGGNKADMYSGNHWSDDLGLGKASAVLDVFAEHLKEQKVPSDVSARVSEEANCAFASLLGMNKVGVLLSQPGSVLPKVLKMWPGILKWSQFLLAARVQTTGPGSDPARSKAALDVIAGCWVSLLAGQHFMSPMAVYLKYRRLSRLRGRAGASHALISRIVRSRSPALGTRGRRYLGLSRH